jgi:hypothetical protein
MRTGFIVFAILLLAVVASAATVADTYVISVVGTDGRSIDLDTETVTAVAPHGSLTLRGVVLETAP